MVKELGKPERPLSGGISWKWRQPSKSTFTGWEWCRVYHLGPHTPDGTAHRRFGPLHRFDTHESGIDGEPVLDPDARRSVLYIGANLATSASEVFGETLEAPLCPNYRVALVEPVRTLRLHDLCPPGAAMAIGALPALADGHVPRQLSQGWARAIQDDEPAGPVEGIHYRSAYFGGESLALWGTEGDVTTVRNGVGGSQDFPLRNPSVFRRLLVSLENTRIRVRLIDMEDCRMCSR